MKSIISSGLELELTHKSRLDLEVRKGNGWQRRNGEQQKVKESKRFLRASSRGNNKAGDNHQGNRKQADQQEEHLAFLRLEEAK